jgi:PIN domain nuclease of toxin-antitoxin system
VPAPLLDTHVWIWWIQADPRLDRPTQEALDALPDDDRPGISDISLWEVAISGR